MKQQVILASLLVFLCCGCGSPSDAEKASALVEESRLLVVENHLNEAKIRLDSVHHTYPKCVAQRTVAKALQDSIVYIEAQRTLAYSDSLLILLQPQVDPLLKKFNYEKQERYEDQGRYVNKLLNTDRNTQRCYLQSYVTDDRVTSIKSYYFGAVELAQTAVELAAGEDVMHYEGKSHCFEAGGYYSILTIDDEKALELLNFVSSHMGERIRVNLIGKRKESETNYVYYLNEQEKQALQDTYQLGVLMKDIKRLEDAIRISNLQIEKFEKKRGML